VRAPTAAALAADRDAFVLKLDADGNLVWINRFRGAGSQVAASGRHGRRRECLRGGFMNGIDFGEEQTAIGEPLDTRLFLAKLAP
jgi:hypothetical protein